MGVTGKTGVLCNSLTWEKPSRGEEGVEFFVPSTASGQGFYQDFMPVFLSTYIPLMFIILAPNALGLNPQ